MPCCLWVDFSCDLFPKTPVSRREGCPKSRKRLKWGGGVGSKAPHKTRGGPPPPHPSFCTLSHSLAHSLTQTNKHSLLQTLTHTNSLTHRHTHTNTRTHKHSLTHIRTLTHTYPRQCRGWKRSPPPHPPTAKERVTVEGTTNHMHPSLHTPHPASAGVLQQEALGPGLTECKHEAACQGKTPQHSAQHLEKGHVGRDPRKGGNGTHHTTLPPPPHPPPIKTTCLLWASEPGVLKALPTTRALALRATALRATGCTSCCKVTRTPTHQLLEGALVPDPPRVKHHDLIRVGQTPQGVGHKDAGFVAEDASTGQHPFKNLGQGGRTRAPTTHRTRKPAYLTHYKLDSQCTVLASQRTHTLIHSHTHTLPPTHQIHRRQQIHSPPHTRTPHTCH